jgi:large subunit ribosomal protein L32
VAVPKRKMSRANTRARRSQWKAAPVALSTCSQCGESRRPHIACPSCGAYSVRTYASAVRSEHQGD